MRYLKAAGMVVATGIMALIGALVTPGVDSREWINIALAVAGAAAVFAAPNVPGASYTKSVLAVITAVLMLAVNMIAGGIDLSETLQMVLAALGAVGVYALPNEGGPVALPPGQ